MTATAPSLADLAAGRLGGMVLAASDEFFAPKERLLEPEPPVFRAGLYTDRGKWMDGWETRRRRGPGHDWALVRLGLPGVVRAVVVDTTHFRGNHPAACSVEGLDAGAAAPTDRLPDAPADWHELLPRTPLEEDAEQRFPVEAEAPLVTHVRLNLYPDGGVARLRVLGEPTPDLRRLAVPDGRLDLAAAVNGAEVVACSDMSFAVPGNLLLPGDALDMRDGWETRRRRGGGHDWAVVRLAARGVIERVEVDTTHYKGNYPERCELEACAEPAAVGAVPEGGWWNVVPPSPLGPHARHAFAAAPGPAATHVRLAIHPDGGVSRLRVWGQVSEEGWRRWGLRRLDALTARRAEVELLTCCGSREWASRVAAARPFATFEALAEVAGKVWESLGPDDWLEAFAAHPRIGEASTSPESTGGLTLGSASRPGAVAGASLSSPPDPLSTREQAGVAGAGAEVMAALAEGNRAYEARFGHVFLVCASGRSGGELLAELRERLGNDPATELEVAAGEQRKITRLRLEGLLRP